jgi:hypothetical protein
LVYIQWSNNVILMLAFTFVGFVSHSWVVIFSCPFQFLSVLEHLNKLVSLIGLIPAVQTLSSVVFSAAITTWAEWVSCHASDTNGTSISDSSGMQTQEIVLNVYNITTKEAQGQEEKCLNITQKNALNQFLELNCLQEWRLSDVSESVVIFISRLMNLRIFGRAPYINSEGCGKKTVTLPHTTHWQICIRATDSNCVCRNAEKAMFQNCINDAFAKFHKWFIAKTMTSNSGVTKFMNLKFMDPCIVVWLSRNNQQDATL